MSVEQDFCIVDVSKESFKISVCVCNPMETIFALQLSSNRLNIFYSLVTICCEWRCMQRWKFAVFYALRHEDYLFLLKISTVIKENKRVLWVRSRAKSFFSKYVDRSLFLRLCCAAWFQCSTRLSSTSFMVGSVITKKAPPVLFTAAWNGSARGVLSLSVLYQWSHAFLWRKNFGTYADLQQIAW